MSLPELIGKFENIVPGFEHFKMQLENDLHPNPEEWAQLLKYWETNYGSLHSSWQVVRRLPQQPKTNTLRRHRLQVLFFDANSLSDLAVLSQGNLSGQDPDENSIDRLVKKLVVDRRLISQSSPYDGKRTASQLTDRFTQKTVDAKNDDFDRVLLHVCSFHGAPCIGDLFHLLTLIEPAPLDRDAIKCINKDGTVILSEDPAGFNLAVARTSSNPLAQIIRTFTGIRAIKKERPEDIRGKTVQAVSWIIQPKTERILKNLGLLPERGGVIYYDLNEMFRSPLKPNEIYPQEEKFRIICIASLIGVQSSPANLRRFLTFGEIPNVGILTLPAEDFFTP